MWWSGWRWVCLRIFSCLSGCVCVSNGAWQYVRMFKIIDQKKWTKRIKKVQKMDACDQCNSEGSPFSLWLWLFDPLDLLFSLPLAFGLDVVPLDKTFHSSTFSMELNESSDISITDCWYSLGVSGLMLLLIWGGDMSKGVALGTGVRPAKVP